MIFSVSQSTCFLERYVKTEGDRWLLEEYRDPNGSILLESVEESLAIADIYRGVDFATEE